TSWNATSTIAARSSSSTRSGPPRDRVNSATASSSSSGSYSSSPSPSPSAPTSSRPSSQVVTISALDGAPRPRPASRRLRSSSPYGPPLAAGEGSGITSCSDSSKGLTAAAGRPPPSPRRSSPSSSARSSTSSSSSPAPSRSSTNVGGEPSGAVG